MLEDLILFILFSVLCGWFLIGGISLPPQATTDRVYKVYKFDIHLGFTHFHHFYGPIIHIYIYIHMYIILYCEYP